MAESQSKSHAQKLKFPRVYALRESDRPRIAVGGPSKVPVLVRQHGLFRILEVVLAARAPGEVGTSDAQATCVAEATREEERLARGVASKEAYSVQLVTCLRRLKHSEAPDPALAQAMPRTAAPQPGPQPGAPTVKRRRTDDGQAPPSAAKSTIVPDSRSKQRARAQPSAPVAPAVPAAATSASGVGASGRFGPRCPVCGHPCLEKEDVAAGGDLWHRACLDATGL
jgi:hypothetical protein